jgi:hypothetical protein
MNFILAAAAWIFIAIVLGLGLFLMAVKGSPWLFVISVIGFIVAVGKIGCGK